MSQSHIDEFVQLVRGKEAKDLGPAILYVNQLNMPDMLKAFFTLMTDERKKFEQAAFKGIPKKGDIFDHVLPESKRVGLKRIEFAFRTIVDGRVPASVPDTLWETGQLWQAYDFLKQRPPTKNVWVSVMTDVCEDARLHEHVDRTDTGKIRDKDASYGQAGWDIGISLGDKQFHTIQSVMTSRCRPHLINKLAINAHGKGGEVSVNGVFRDKGNNQLSNDPPLTVLTMKSKFNTVLDFFRNVIVPEGSLSFQSCLAAEGAAGDALLKALSVELWPRRIIAFTTIGFMAQTMQERRGRWSSDKCIEPGVRDGNSSYEGSEKEQYTRYFKDGEYRPLTEVPWQSENSVHVKIAQGGAIINKGAEAN